MSKKKKANQKKDKRTVVSKSPTTFTKYGEFYVNSKVLLLDEPKFVANVSTNRPVEKIELRGEQTWEQMIHNTSPTRKKLLRDFEERGLHSYKQGHKEALQGWHPPYERLGCHEELKSSDVVPRNPKSPTHPHPKNGWFISKR